MNFQAFNKIPRLSKSFWCTITEKIDGSNAQVYITDDFDDFGEDVSAVVASGTCPQDGRQLNLRVGSRNRWIKPGKETDNYGFASWCVERKDELFKLGPGQHFGEWYGSGIQCGYGLTGGDKRFALFNARRWGAAYEARKAGHENDFPSCVEVVPWLYSGAYTQEAVDYNMKQLKECGSFAVPGFMAPEGIIVEMGDQLAKHTFMHSEGKWLSVA
ncbi:RNA ligase family protein [Rhizobium leguminosarum]|uniref:RNA ligase family protein n=1 Tax=Rhizobium leguminosarum TaxID=384 RepID=UPI0004B78550|nr:RNA ligase family protein [Rhizobium leguminosarum]